jgi:limonene-1,2-epoxide hydrolase
MWTTLYWSSVPSAPATSAINHVMFLGALSFMAGEHTASRLQRASTMSGHTRGMSSTNGRERYQAFLKNREHERLTDRRTKQFKFRLEFDDPKVLHERIVDENDHFQEDLREDYPSYVPLAMADFTREEAESSNPSLLDEFFVVDTADDAHAVLLWTHDGGFTPYAKSFSDFLDGLET